MPYGNQTRFCPRLLHVRQLPYSCTSAQILIVSLCLCSTLPSVLATGPALHSARWDKLTLESHCLCLWLCCPLRMCVPIGLHTCKARLSLFPSGSVYQWHATPARIPSGPGTCAALSPCPRLSLSVPEPAFYSSPVLLGVAGSTVVGTCTGLAPHPAARTAHLHCSLPELRA